MKVVTLEVQEIQKDILSAVEVLLQTKREFERIRNEGDEIIELAVNYAKKYGIDTLYGFAEKNRKSLPPKETENK